MSPELLTFLPVVTYGMAGTYLVVFVQLLLRMSGHKERLLIFNGCPNRAFA